MQVRYEQAKLHVEDMQLESPLVHWMPDQRQLSLDGGVEGVDSSGAFSAQQVDIDVQRDQLRARGRIQVRRGAVLLEADEWVEQWRSRHSAVRGDPARYARGERSVEGRHLVYARDAECIEARGAVLFAEGARRLAASTMVMITVGRRSWQEEAYPLLVQNGRASCDQTAFPLIWRQSAARCWVVRSCVA